LDNLILFKDFQKFDVQCFVSKSPELVTVQPLNCTVFCK